MKEAGRFGRWLGLLGALAQPPGEIPQPEKPQEEKQEIVTTHVEHKNYNHPPLRKESKISQQEREKETSEDEVLEEVDEPRDSVDDFFLDRSALEHTAEIYLYRGRYPSEYTEEIARRTLTCVQSLQINNQPPLGWTATNDETKFWISLTSLHKDEYSEKETSIVGLLLSTSTNRDVHQILFREDEAMSFDDRVGWLVVGSCADAVYQDILHERGRDDEKNDDDTGDMEVDDTGD